MKMHLCLGIALLVLLPATGLCAPPIQLYIELTPEGGTLNLEPGVYSGPAVINKSMMIDGGGQAVIDGEGDGTVVHIKADKVRLAGVRITGSGNSHDQVDAGILLEANDVHIENNVIDDVLFGIHLKKSHDNIIRGNDISSRPVKPTLRGEGLRLWYSSENRIENNRFQQVRDIYFTNSPDNYFVNNSIQNSRVAMELVFSHGTEIDKNDISHNGRGVVVVYSDELKIRQNRLHHMRDFAASALSLKESSKVLIEDNEILHCAVGVTANSPIHEENVFTMQRNYFAYNDIALYFYGERGGHVIRDNRFEQNLQQVAVSNPASARGHKWLGNHWDDYQGFDLDGDGRGDQPYELFLYSDRIWLDRPMARFFRGSPVMETLDFLERLSAFSEPKLVLSDPEPRMH